MEQPEGFVDPDHPEWVCEILRSLYGLKQSPRQWNAKLHQFLLSAGLHQSSYDPSIYYTKNEGHLKGLVVAHVDDLAITGHDEFIDTFITKLKSTFEVSRDEPLSHFLSLQIQRETSSTASINQSHYIDDLVEKFLPSDARAAKTPTDDGFKLLVPSTSSKAIDEPYSSLVGSLLWIAQCSRPDVAFPVNRLSQFLQKPDQSHWEAAIRVLSYLNGTKSLKLYLGGDLESVNAFSDADWAEDRHERKSTTGYVFKLGEGVISWRSRKQKTVSLSSTEAEYMAMSDSCREARWLFHVLEELTVVK